MTNSVSNYDGAYTASPRELVYAETVEQIQAVLRDPARYPSPVRAMGSYHSLTPCASSDGTMVNMSRMNRVLRIDRDKMTVTVQAGIQLIEVAAALLAEGVQLLTNAEIGNMTLGSAACCHSKDALDGVEFGQVSSYVTNVKWVSPSGDLQEADQERSPDLLRLVRSSYGLCGIVYEVTLRVEPLEAALLTYLPRPVDRVTEAEVDSLVATSEGLICWTVGRTAVFQAKKRIAKPGPFATLQAKARHMLWNYYVAFFGRSIERYFSLRSFALDVDFALIRLIYRVLKLTGGLSILDPAKIVDYRRTGPSARYAFSFWAFPRDRWLSTLREYLDFSDDYYRRHGFRCNMPLGSYYIRHDTSSLLSYTGSGDMISIDPIHAPGDRAAWERFLREFNEFATKRGGVPLLNQSPFVTRAHLDAAYGPRWQQFSDWVKTMDPGGRMLNPFFGDLLAPPAGS
jgi:hypothetical protein